MSWQQQLGNMASTLARVSNNAAVPDHDEVVVRCLREAACFIEWSAPNVPSVLLLELAAMQRELLAWHRVWPIEAARPLLALHARNQSDRILQMAGFYDFAQELRKEL
jgi:hypothetical protein